QSYMRMKLAVESFAELRGAATICQHVWRAVLAGRAQRAAYLQLKQAAITLQAHWRGKQGRIRAKKVQLALATQSVVRMQNEHRAFEALRQAAMTLQAHWRGKQGRIRAKQASASRVFAPSNSSRRRL